MSPFLPQPTRQGQQSSFSLLRAVWNSKEGWEKRGGWRKQAGSEAPVNPATLKMAARLWRGPSEAVPAHAQRRVPARDTRWRQRRWGGRGGGGKTGGRAERVAASPRVRSGQLLMQGIPWAPVHSTADQFTHLCRAFLQASPTSVGPCDVGVHPAGEENPLMLALQTPKGERKGGPHSALKLWAQPPQHWEFLFPREPRQLGFFLPWLMVPNFFVSKVLFCCIYVLLPLSFYLSNCINEVTIHFSLSKLTKTSMTECTIKSNVPRIPMMLSTAN
ncbi:PREDICTED: uncharacterized protein LOC103589591 [Galeopterus variegatus]|uniref:Uncharacterized protein LOC103589591 n=1 Tax=Galeopterus variegatus TaxID=482537 RepID=A0ABM0QN90_GALVR|nr:PREDICTED: uncharacterized protein LOC103589591 [Galeopterus variegatus]